MVKFKKLKWNLIENGVKLNPRGYHEGNSIETVVVLEIFQLVP